MVVLGVDPGLAHLGWARLAVERSGVRLLDCGAVHTTPRDGDSVARVAMLVAAVREQFAGVDLIAIETQYMPRGAGEGARAYSAAQVHGVAVAVGQAATEAGIEVRGVAPSQAKRALAGNGRAAKRAMTEAARRWFGVEASEHVADAIGVALAGAGVAGVPAGGQAARGARANRGGGGEGLDGLPEAVQQAARRAKRS